MSWVIIFGIIAIGLLLYALFSGAETGFYCASRARLHLGVQQDDPRALHVSGILKDEQTALGLTLVGANVANYVITITMAYLFADLMGLSELDSELYTVLILTPVVFAFGEAIPKTLFQRHPYVWLMRCSLILAGAYQLLRLTGTLRLIKGLTNLTARLTGMSAVGYQGFNPKQRVALLLQEALAGHSAGDDQSYLVDRVVQLSEMPVQTVMVPWNQVVTLASRADCDELLRVARKTAYARLPVFDADPRHIIGIAVVNELLATEGWSWVGDKIAPAETISPEQSVAAAIGHMQAVRCNMAVVADRRGRMLGVVTLRGLLEEVLGELAIDVEHRPLWG